MLQFCLPVICTFYDKKSKKAHLNQRGNARYGITVRKKIIILLIENFFQAEFESLFRKYDDSASFLYLKSFRRARVNFSTPEMAATARIHLNEVELYGKRVKCYFAQVKIMFNYCHLGVIMIEIKSSMLIQCPPSRSPPLISLIWQYILENMLSQ